MLIINVTVGRGAVLVVVPVDIGSGIRVIASGVFVTMNGVTETFVPTTLIKQTLLVVPGI